jgi:hypothetical protein
MLAAVAVEPAVSVLVAGIVVAVIEDIEEALGVYSHGCRKNGWGGI